MQALERPGDGSILRDAVRRLRRWRMAPSVTGQWLRYLTHPLEKLPAELSVMRQVATGGPARVRFQLMLVYLIFRLFHLILLAKLPLTDYQRLVLFDYGHM